MKKKKKDEFIKYGSIGGQKTLEKYGKTHYSRIAKEMHAKRRKEKSGS